ncbi:MAG TPA: haloacid dehalogenase type II [Gammaproteobacteria bacterium]|nr:haloacid dehalogenase type II [Gammaproteobacteria bacterium]
MHTFRLITFDCYSALFDYKSALIPVLQEQLGMAGTQAESMLSLWRAKQLEAAALSNGLDKGRISFRECTRISLRYALRRHGLRLPAGQGAALVDAWDALNPWPEANAVLRHIKGKGYRIALLSNGDQAMLAALAAGLDVPVDDIFSSESCGRYKPDPRIYHLPASRLGIAVTQYLHVAGGAGDVVGAKAAGVTCFWSNRAADHVLLPAYEPDFQSPSLDGLIDVL